MVGFSSMSFSWSSSDNPPGTLYTVQASTTSDFSGVTTTSITYNVYLTTAGLNLATTYYFQVVAINNNGIPTTSTAASVSTLAATPVGNPSFSMVGLSSITLTWPAAGDGVQYSVLSSTASNPSLPAGAVVAASATYNTSLSSAALNANTTYYFQVAAFGNGIYTTPIGTATLAYQPITAVTTFTAVYASSMSVSWAPGLNPIGVTTYTVVLTSSPAYPNDLGGNLILSTVPAGAPSATFTGLGVGTTYYLFVDARNWDNASSGYVSLGSTVTAPSASMCFPPGGTLVLNTTQGPITAVFPPNAFSGCIQASFLLAPDCPAPASNAAALSPVGVCAEISVNPTWAPQQPIAVSASYLPEGLTPGLSASQLVLAYYATAQNAWVPMPLASSPGSSPVSAQLSQLSYFQLMAAIPTTNLANGKVYPNPFRPALGQSLITFSQLPANTRVRVYTILGELVKDFDTDATGMARWDATNQNGQNVASGSYFALVQGGGSKTILKVLIQR
jgi:hypothetical protein